jgi:hypothetical protein
MTLHWSNVWEGFIAGLLCSIGGALKDSPYEGFKPLVFLRSVVVGTVWGGIVIGVDSHPILIFTLCGYMERLTVEGYKIIRGQKPGKFDFIDKPRG